MLLAEIIPLFVFYGTVVYIVNLSKINAEDITLDDNDHVITVRIPHAEQGGITIHHGGIE